MEDRYLGDGVYASFDGHHIVLKTGTTKIGLDPEVLKALVDYREDIKVSIKVLKDRGLIA